MWFFIRHGESTANSDRILGGRGDYPLSEKGVRQIELIAAQIKSKLPAIQTIVSSPQPRAWQTAARIAAVLELAPHAISSEELLQEHDVGCYTGMSYDKIKAEPDYQTAVDKRWYWRPPGGESYAEVARRAQRLLYNYHRQSDQNIIFVSHAVTMRLIHAVLTNTLPNYPTRVCANGEIWQCEFRKLFSVHQIVVHRFPGITDHRS